MNLTEEELRDIYSGKSKEYDFIEITDDRDDTHKDSFIEAMIFRDIETNKKYGVGVLVLQLSIGGELDFSQSDKIDCWETEEVVTTITKWIEKK